MTSFVCTACTSAGTGGASTTGEKSTTVTFGVSSGDKMVDTQCAIGAESGDGNSYNLQRDYSRSKLSVADSIEDFLVCSR